jgi:hypothetical protein
MALDVFRRQAQLEPKAMTTVAERRFDDARVLCKTNENARAAGAAYLAGFVIEILLKAQLVRTYPLIARKRQHEVDKAEQQIWSLVWRSHDLEAMLNQMPQLEAALQKTGERSGRDYVAHLKSICSSWTIQAGYSSLSMEMKEAQAMLERVRSLKEVLK